MNDLIGSRCVAALLTVLLMAGCAKVRYPTNYTLNLPPTVPQMADPDGAIGPVLVRQFSCPDYICQGRIVYRPSPEEVGFYEYHRWAMDPRESITNYVADSLRNKASFNQVTTHERDMQPAFVLTGSIDRLEEVDRATDVRVVCALSAQLIDSQTRSVVWSDAATETRLVDQRNVSGVVRSMSSAVQATVDQLMKSMAKQLRSTP